MNYINLILYKSYASYIVSLYIILYYIIQNIYIFSYRILVHCITVPHLKVYCVYTHYCFTSHHVICVPYQTSLHITSYRIISYRFIPCHTTLEKSACRRASFYQLPFSSPSSSSIWLPHGFAVRKLCPADHVLDLTFFSVTSD